MDNIKNDFENIKIPDKLDYTIENSLKRARKRRRLNFIRNLSTAIAAVFAVFILTVNTSSVFAQTMMKIPIIKNIVELVKFDKGLENAVKEGYINAVDKSAEDKGIKVTVDNIIYDNKRLVILYSIETEKPCYDVYVRKLKLSDEKRKEIGGCTLSYGMLTPNDEHNLFKGNIDVHFMENKQVPSIIYLSSDLIDIKYNDGDNYTGIEGNWRIEIKIPNYICDQSNNYSIDKEILIGDIKVKIKEANISLTTCEIGVSFKSNKYKSISLVNARIIDEKGTVYKNYLSTYSIINEYENNYNYIFESPLFSKSKHLKLYFDGIYFIPNRDDYIVVDIKNNKIIDNAGYGIELKYINKEKNELKLGFTITDEEILKNNKKYNYVGGIDFGDAYDENGEKCGVAFRGFGMDGDKQYQDISIENFNPKTKLLKIKIERACKGIMQEVSVDIK
ncbi:MAG: DUF4179 domain-containing protein [Caloramator sp.]|nr:DUF4179 domain-containing protein [Caloramator sp.]